MNSDLIQAFIARESQIQGTAKMLFEQDALHMHETDLKTSQSSLAQLSVYLLYAQSQAGLHNKCTVGRPLSITLSPEIL